MAGIFHKEAELLAEPTLDELLAEPIIQLFMKRDGIKPSEVRGHLRRFEPHYTAQPAM